MAKIKQEDAVLAATEKANHEKTLDYYARRILDEPDNTTLFKEIITEPPLAYQLTLFMRQHKQAVPWSIEQAADKYALEWLSFIDRMKISESIIYFCLLAISFGSIIALLLLALL